MMTVVLTCADARVDPAHFLGLEPGDAVVLRNLGGRVDAAVERELSLLWGMVTLARGGDGPPVHLAIVQHTNCGLERLSKPEVRSALGGMTGLPSDELCDLALYDQREALAADVERLRASPVVPNETVVSCHVLDVTTGRVATVSEPGRLG